MNLIQRALAVTGLVDRLQPVALLALRLYVSMSSSARASSRSPTGARRSRCSTTSTRCRCCRPTSPRCVGAFGELTFPVLITLGLMGRFGAAGLFVVNAMAVISYPQLWGFDCPAGIQCTSSGARSCSLLALFGPGKLSLDELILKRMGLRPAA
jgi:putative oxidoreductase